MIYLDFVQPVEQTVVDKDGQGTGFTSVQPNTANNQLDSTRIDLDNGLLKITTQAGSNTSSNDLKNALQVNVANPGQFFSASTRINGPFTGFTQASTQAGVFIGVDQNTYVKFVVIRNTTGIVLQFYREENGVRSQIATVSGINWTNVQYIDLYLNADPTKKQIVAQFKTNLSTAVNTVSVPFAPVVNSPLFLTGVKAGIIATSPGAGQQVVVPFDSFQVFSQGIKKFDFTTTTGTLETGYTRDDGSAYSPNASFGWVTRTTKTPLSVVSDTRVRGTSVDKRLDSLAHMQRQGKDAAWEVVLPNGQYHVCVGVGDATSLDSTHKLNAEGINIVDSFRPNTTQRFMILSKVVNITDGKLTLDAFGGVNTKILFAEIESISPSLHPSVQIVTVSRDSSGRVFTDSAIAMDLNLPSGGLTAVSVNPTNIILYETSSGLVSKVFSSVNTSGGGDVIVLTPSAQLKPSTSYTLEVSSAVKDDSNNSMIPYTYTFVTGIGNSTGTGTGGDPSEPNQGNGMLPAGADTVTFSKETLNVGTDPFASLVVGPDNKLYATTLDGKIHRWTIDSNGTLSSKQTFAPTRLARRAIIGITFDPNNPNQLWISHNDPVYPQPATNFTGVVSKLTITGNDTASWSASIDDYVVGLPRASKDHLSNSLAFHNGKLYLSQGSLSAMGRADTTWNNRNESKLSGTILEIDITHTGPINVRDDSGYEDRAVNAPVKVFAEGTRNAYDLVWHSNGSLYVPTNGSAAGGNTPDDPRTTINESLTGVSSQNDYLFRVVNGGYYGHPNPTRGSHFIMNGGNPTSSSTLR